jgi:hypothetical protein
MSRQQLSQVRSPPIAFSLDLYLGMGRELESSEGFEKIQRETLHKNIPKTLSSGEVEDFIVEEVQLPCPGHGPSNAPCVPDGSECHTITVTIHRASEAEEVVDLVKERKLRRKLDVTYVCFLGSLLIIT